MRKKSLLGGFFSEGRLRKFWMLWRKIFGFTSEKPEESKPKPVPPQQQKPTESKQQPRPKLVPAQQQKPTESKPSQLKQEPKPSPPVITDSSDSSDDFSFPRLRRHIDFGSCAKPAPVKPSKPTSIPNPPSPDDKSPTLVKFCEVLPQETPSVTEPVSILRASQSHPDDCEEKVRSMFQSLGNSPVSTPMKVSFQKPQTISFSTPKKGDALSWDLDDEAEVVQLIPPKPQVLQKKDLSGDHFEDVDPPKTKSRRYF